MQKELLSPDSLTPLLKARRLELQNALNIKLKAQEKAPHGHLRITHPDKGRSPQFYHTTNTEDRNGVYLKQSQTALIKNLAQKDFDLKLIKLLQAQLHALEKLISITEGRIGNLYSKLSPTRQTLVTPATLTDSQYVEEWNNIVWEGLSFSEDAPEFFTAKNERVRSKSEVIIADTLYRNNIPYRYEYSLELGGNIFHPDFLCLNLSTRKEFLWEHFGMMDNPEYLENVIRKLKIYYEHDIIPGKNFIITMETQSSPINIRQIEKLITVFLK